MNGDGKLKVLAVADPAVMVYADEKQGILERFSHPVTMDIVPWDTYYPLMMEVFAGRADYDVVMVAGHLWKRDLAEQGHLAEIDLAQEDILPVILTEMQYEGKYYLSPSFCDGHMIVYRKSILKEVTGTEFGSVITPAEYIAAAEKLHEQGYRIAMKAHSSEIFTDALPFLRMHGQDVYRADGEITCNTPEVIDGLERYCALQKCALDYTDSFGNEEVAAALRCKEAAMGVTWSGQLGVVWDDACIEPEDLGFATFDTGWNVTWSFALSAAGKRKELAGELLEFLRSPEVDRIAGSASGAPVRESSYREGSSTYPWYDVQLQMFGTAALLPDLKDAGAKNGVLYQEISETFSGRKTAAAAMAAAEQKIRQLQEE